MLLLIPSISQAEPFTLNIDEPTANLNDCWKIHVYYCWGATCENWQRAATFDASDANCGQASRDLVVDVPVPEGRVPGTLRFRVTVENTDRNENTGVIGSKSVT